MSEQGVGEIVGVPTWLETPPTTVVSGTFPVHSRIQVLPFHELTWENFERLCVRYVRGQASIVMCQLYGTRGQEQEGIDLYARLSDPARYEVYQCKRLAKLIPSDIKNAIDKFLEGKWKTSAKAFHILTSHPIEEKNIADAIVKGQQRLQEIGIEFTVLGQEQLSLWLKDQPTIVDDYFSRPWVEPFCGPNTADALSKRLNGQTVALYRRRLKNFYEVLFSKYDPGIPVKATIGEKERRLQDRFVVPNIYASLNENNSFQESTKAQPPDQEAKEINKRSPSFPVSAVRTRFDADKWIGQAHRSVILGIPGSGKSALLRTLAIELLSETTMFKQIAIRWGAMLPVWVPFSYWTKLNARRESPASLRECLETWFNQFDQPDAWALVAQAIEDDRLLLLVDGLDEWTDSVAAGTTSTQLQTFIQLRNLPAVLVSRPRGFERVSIQGPDWQIGSLAPLTTEQQQELISKWVTIHHSRGHQERDATLGPDLDVSVRQEAYDFMKKLDRSRDLAQLAEVPLTLLLLLYLKLQNVPLPTSRFEAYEYVVRHFIKEHPLLRKTSASLTDVSKALDDDEVRHALAYVAFDVQSDFPTGILSDLELQECLDRFLREDAEYGLELSRKEANEVKKSFTNIEEGSLGLLVSQGQGQVSFFHRSIQEYLAAVHIARMSLVCQIEILKVNLTDSRWRDVIAGVINLCQRGEEATTLVASIENLATDVLGTLAKDDVLAEIAFKNAKLPPAQARALSARTFHLIETSFVASHRSRLLAHAMSGLQLRKNRAPIQHTLRRWIFSRGLWGPGRIEALKLWPADESTWDVLFRALHDEDPGVIRESANVIASLFASNLEHGEVLTQFAFASDNHYLRAASIEALGKGWSQSSTIPEVLASGVNCEAPEVRLAAIIARTRLGIHEESDFEHLMSLASNRRSSSLAYIWRDDITEALSRGWKGDARLKSACFKSLNVYRHGNPEVLDQDYVKATLIAAFPQDDEVATWIAGELKSTYPFNSSRREVWPLLPQHFRDHPTVVEALDLWAEAESYRDVIALHHGSLVGRTPVMKDRLFKAIEEFNPFWAVSSLLEGWGMDDQEVAQRLTQRATKDDAAEFGQHLPAILGNEAGARLTELLRTAKSPRIDFLMAGIGKLGDSIESDEPISLALERFATDDRLKSAYAGSLIATFPEDERVKTLARTNLHEQSPFLNAIVAAAAHDQKLRSEVAEFLTPLSADLRNQIVADLPMFADLEFTLDLLRDWDSERQAEIKTSASIQYHQSLLRSGCDIKSAIDTLESIFPCYGPDYEARRQAAGAGLILLKSLDRVVGKIESIGHTGHQVNIALTGGLHANPVFVDIIAKYWNYVKPLAGEDFSLLKERVGSEPVLEQLAAAGSESPELLTEICLAADEHWELRRSASVLRLLAKTEPGSERLLNACLETLRRRESWHDWYGSVDAASEILAEQFRGDADVETRILELASDESVPTPVIMALSLGWPTNELLRRLDFSSATGERTASELYTKYAVIPTHQLASAVADELNWARDDQFRVGMFTKPLLSRLRFDTQCSAQLFQLLQSSQSPDVKASFPRLLAAVGEMTPDRVLWCSEELERQTKRKSPEVGYDVIAETRRSVRLCLLNAIGIVHSAPSLVSVNPD